MDLLGIFRVRIAYHSTKTPVLVLPLRPLFIDTDVRRLYVMLINIVIVVIIIAVLSKYFKEVYDDVSCC